MGDSTRLKAEWKTALLYRRQPRKKGHAAGRREESGRQMIQKTAAKLPHKTGNKPRERQQRRASRQKNNDTKDDDKDKFQI